MNPDFEKIKKALGILRAILLRICALIALAGALVLARSAVNAVFLHLYSTGNYAVFPENLLIYLPFGENYVVPYNLGNAQFQHGNYEKAIYYYTLAWQNDPPAHPEHDEECRIRVNLAFSMCHTIDFDNLDLSDPEAVAAAVATLQQARAILTEAGCASEPGGGGGRDNNDSGGDGQDQDQSQDKDQDRQNSGRSKSQEEEEKAERARQEKLKEDLEQQKEDLKDTHSSSSYDYEYIDTGDAQGYGEGTLW